jgi:hypothetical protein
MGAMWLEGWLHRGNALVWPAFGAAGGSWLMCAVPCRFPCVLWQLSGNVAPCRAFPFRLT